MKRLLLSLVMLFVVRVLFFPPSALAGDLALSELPENARKAVIYYSTAVIKVDVKKIRRYLHPLQMKRGYAAQQKMTKLYKKLKENQILPEQIEFADAALFSDADDRIYFIPYVSVQKGFPADVRTGHLYLVVSADTGKTWKIVAADCAMSNELVKKLAPGYKGEPSLEKLYQRAYDLAAQGRKTGISNRTPVN